MIQVETTSGTMLLTLDELLHQLDITDDMLAEDAAAVAAKIVALPPDVRDLITRRADLIRQHTLAHGLRMRRVRAELARRRGQ